MRYLIIAVMLLGCGKVVSRFSSVGDHNGSIEEFDVSFNKCEDENLEYVEELFTENFKPRLEKMGYSVNKASKNKMEIICKGTRSTGFESGDRYWFTDYVITLGLYKSFEYRWKTKFYLRDTDDEKIVIKLIEELGTLLERDLRNEKK